MELTSCDHGVCEAAALSADRMGPNSLVVEIRAVTRFGQWTVFGHSNLTPERKRAQETRATASQQLWQANCISVFVSQLLQSAILSFAGMTNNKGEERQQ